MKAPAKGFVRGCNHFLREWGGYFSGDAPGRVIEQWVAVVDQNGPVPKLQALAKFLAVSGLELKYSDEAEKAFSVLWRRLASQGCVVAAIQSAGAVMRVFRALPKGSDVLDAARDRFLEANLSDNSVVPPNRQGAS
jgi:hypothetical protein